MTFDLASAFDIATLVIALLLLVLGVGVIVRLVRRGGFELTFAHLVASPARRALFLKALYTSLASLFALGLGVSVEVLLGVPAVVVAGTETALFAIGAVGIIVLMQDAFKGDPLTLGESWALRESAERNLLEISRVPVAPEWPPGLGGGASDPRRDR